MKGNKEIKYCSSWTEAAFCLLQMVFIHLDRLPIRVPRNHQKTILGVNANDSKLAALLPPEPLEVLVI
jgi:hypothetical protein